MLETDDVESSPRTPSPESPTSSSRKLSIRLPQALLNRLERDARAEDKTLSALIVARLETSDPTSVDPSRQGADLERWGQRLEKVLRQEVRHLGQTLSPLTARGALEAAVARLLIFQGLVDSRGRDEAGELSNQAWGHAVDSLKAPSKGVRRLMEEDD